MYRLSLRGVRIPPARRMLSEGSDENCILVKSGPNEGYKIRANFKNRNPRNLEMMNIAHRDQGWAAGPGNRTERFLGYHHTPGRDRSGMRLAVTNLPAHNGYHSVEINR